MAFAGALHALRAPKVNDPIKGQTSAGKLANCY